MKWPTPSQNLRCNLLGDGTKITVLDLGRSFDDFPSHVSEEDFAKVNPHTNVNFMTQTTVACSFDKVNPRANGQLWRGMSELSTLAWNAHSTPKLTVRTGVHFIKTFPLAEE